MACFFFRAATTGLNKVLNSKCIFVFLVLTRRGHEGSNSFYLPCLHLAVFEVFLHHPNKNSNKLL